VEFELKVDIDDTKLCNEGNTIKVCNHPMMVSFFRDKAENLSIQGEREATICAVVYQQ
jgi:hypothetical protein